jgi:hypothetical protein
MARSILKAKALPSFFWGEAVHTEVHLLNRAPTRALDGKTPFEAWYGERPAVHYLRTFGCVTHVKTTKPGLQKLDDQSTPTIFVGYESGSKAYRCYDPSTKRVVISRDVVFDEAARWDWSSSPDVHPGDDEPFTVELVTEAVHVPGAMPSASPPLAQSPSPGPAAATMPQGSPGGASPPYFATPPADVDHDALDADHDDDAPLRFRAIDSIVGPASPPGLAARVLDEELMFTSADEPASFGEAERAACWRQAMRDELRSIEENAAWEPVPLPAGHRAIGLKWVFKVKRDELGNIIRHKARLVAKGYV